ncbi:hypothetical protein PanWU01x14_085370 [Parasponia andersonii]|uniref:Uncharacterized protein n=1 Tax=Parasponia andersonii TaxID=3476 RepID=A0A2P5D8X0_PARAD|nr:hypothetical protein PanWU01x14_085370 [Parasponia andersonii]
MSTFFLKIFPRGHGPRLPWSALYRCSLVSAASYGLSLSGVRFGTNRHSVKTACPLRTPIQYRIKCSVWVWSCELLSIVFWWKILGASDPPAVEILGASDPPAVEVRVGLGRVCPGSVMGSALTSDSSMADVVSRVTRVAFSQSLSTPVRRTMASGQYQESRPIVDSELDSLRRQLCLPGGVTLQRVEGPADWYLRPSAPELNANGVMILMGLSTLSVLYNLHIDLEGLPRSDKQWDSHTRLYAIGGAWATQRPGGDHHLRISWGLPVHPGHLQPPGDEYDTQDGFIPSIPFPLDTWVITKHLWSRLDASALNRFRRDKHDRIAMVGQQVTASSQLVGSNDLVAPSSHELEEAVRFVAEECVRLRREEAATLKRARDSETGPLADSSPVKGGAAGYKAHPKAPAGRHLVVPSGDEMPTVSRSDTGRPPSGGTSATKTVYGEGMLLSLPGGSAAPTSSTPDSGPKSGATCLGGEMLDLFPTSRPRVFEPLKMYPPTVHVSLLFQSALNFRQGLSTFFLKVFPRDHGPRLLWSALYRCNLVSAASYGLSLSGVRFGTNRHSVKTACPLRTPIQYRIKCSVWVWSCELLSIVFWWKTLGASDLPAVEVRVGLNRVCPGSMMGSALISDSPMADVVSRVTCVAFNQSLSTLVGRWVPFVTYSVA